MPVPLFKVENLVVDFSTRNTLFKTNEIRALNDVSFELFPGESLALVGESGSGKSTCARTLCGLNRFSSGRVLFENTEIEELQTSKHKQHFSSDVQMIFQDPFGSLNPVHTVKHHLLRPLKIHHPETNSEILDKEIEKILLDVGLTPPLEIMGKFPHELSGGQRQRVAIARTLAVGAKVILADEPISMLDVSIRLGILNLMDDLKRKQGISFLYITHDIATARYFSERTAVLYAGHMVEWGESDQVTQNPKHPYTKLLLDSVPDPNRKQRKKISSRKAEVPQWTPDSKGCPFAERCDQVVSTCREKFPPSVQTTDQQFVRCFAVTG